MDRRVGIRIALLVAFAFGAGFLSGRRTGETVPSSSTGPTLDAQGPAPVPASSTSETLAAPPAPGRPGRRVETGADDAAVPGTAAATWSQAVLEGLRPARIRVRVTDVDGKAVPRASLCAIPEGATPRERHWDPQGRTDALGGSDLVVPVAGRYAVLVEADLRVAVQEGVEAREEGETEVAFVLGRLASLEVRRTGASEGARWDVEAVGEEPRLADGTVLYLPVSRSVNCADDSVVLSLPENVPLRIEVRPDWQDRRWAGRAAAGPLTAELSAPGSLRVDFRARSAADDGPTFVQVLVDVAIHPETGVLPPSGRVACTFRQRYADSSSEESSERCIDWGPKDQAPPVSHFESRWPPGTPGRVEWTVAGVSGSVDVAPGRAGEEILLAGDVRIPPSEVETAAGAVEVLDERGVPIPVGGPQDKYVWLFTERGEFASVDGEMAEDELRPWLRDHIGSTLTAMRGQWWVSRPGSTTADGTLRLQLELGGYLLVHMRKPLREGLGELTVECTDGTFLGERRGDASLACPEEDGQYGSRGVKNGTLLGPMPAGDVGLLFRLKGLEVGRTTAHVVAGEVSPLTIR